MARSNEKLDVLITGEALTNEKLDSLLRLTLRRAEQDQRVDRAEAKALQAQNEVEQRKHKYPELMEPSLPLKHCSPRVIWTRLRRLSRRRSIGKWWSKRGIISS